ncbi:MAG: efflux RND transporter periplasmic adaptor subunit [Bacteroidetes bacterium]|nr:efflux RND transporter periplasmic adaptor subunit [Bacteroidota bacterium]
MSKSKSFLVAVGILLFGVIISVIFSSQPGLKPGEPITKSKNNFKTVKTSKTDLSNVVETTGRVNALNKIEVFAEVSGLLTQNSEKFKAGNYFKKGEQLVHIDDEVYKNNLYAQKSNLLNQITLLLPDISFDFPQSAQKWENYLNSFSFDSEIKPLPETSNSKERNYLAAKNIYNLYYTIKSMEATYDKYTIEAPFNGIVTESNINPGTLVRGGQKLGEFIGTAIYEIEVAVNENDAKYLRAGQNVTLESQNSDQNFAGKINRINAAIDRATQMIKVFIRSNDMSLKDGMYVTAKVESGELKNVSIVPRSAVNQEDEVYVLKDNSASPCKVEIVKSLGNNIYVKGLEENDEVLSEHSDFTAIIPANPETLN